MLVAFKKGKVAHEATFDNTPTWQLLCKRVEDLYPELEAEDFSLKAGKLELSAQNWPGVAEGKPSMALGVSSNLCQRHGIVASWPGHSYG